MKGMMRFDLPNELAPVHLVFHVSMLKKCIGDPVSVILIEGLGVDESLSYEEFLVEILDWQVKRLRNKEVPSGTRKRGKCQGKGAKPRLPLACSTLAHLHEWNHGSWSTPWLVNVARKASLAMEKWQPKVLATASTSRKGARLVVFTMARGAFMKKTWAWWLGGTKWPSYCLTLHDCDHGSWSTPQLVKGLVKMP
ncbi:hypothetical protein MTR67_019395 [Solanum verrucosum]|uniref:Uncharacterized protein n=1 Tax=Solanum verrucosum TaxID=315347 RepID=A0AAF0QRR5_SOLVR|nr:hypothetical protein MTR67_019395 [Solanum verrucosum]